MTWFGTKRAEYKPGFRDVRWGNVPPPGMTLLKKEGDEALYMRSGDSMRIGEGRLLSINYQFWKGKLASVSLQIAPGSMKLVMDAIVAVYGKPSQPNPLKQKFYWMGVGPGAEATQAVAELADNGSGTVILISKSLADARKAEGA